MIFGKMPSAGPQGRATRSPALAVQRGGKPEGGVVVLVENYVADTGSTQPNQHRCNPGRQAGVENDRNAQPR